MPEESAPIKFGLCSFGSIHQDLMEGVDWLLSLGVPGVEQTRLGSYLKTLSAFAEAERDGSIWDLLRESDTRQMVAVLLFEAMEWSAIYRVFGERSDPHLTERLRKFIKGPKHQGDERPDSHYPRDIGFELTVAARLAAAGLDPDLGSEADLSIRVGAVPIFLECKRPQTPSGIERNLKATRKQLRRRYCGAEGDSRGLMAVSLTKLVDGMEIRARDLGEVQARLEQLQRQFIHSYSRLWLQTGDRKTLGALIEFRCIGRIESDRVIAPFGAFSLNVQNFAEDQELLDSLTAAIQKGEYALRLMDERSSAMSEPAART